MAKDKSNCEITSSRVVKRLLLKVLALLLDLMVHRLTDFCKQFNDKTKDQQGLILPAVITIYVDRSFTFVVKTPPAAVLIKKELNLTKGSAVPHKEKVGKLSKAQLKKIAEIKAPDLNANDIEAAMYIVAGSARSMGGEVEK